MRYPFPILITLCAAITAYGFYLDFYDECTATDEIKTLVTRRTTLKGDCARPTPGCGGYAAEPGPWERFTYRAYQCETTEWRRTLYETHSFNGPGVPAVDSPGWARISIPRARDRGIAYRDDQRRAGGR